MAEENPVSSVDMTLGETCLAGLPSKGVLCKQIFPHVNDLVLSSAEERIGGWASPVEGEAVLRPRASCPVCPGQCLHSKFPPATQP